MKRLWIGIFALPLLAQLESRIFDVKNGDPKKIGQMLGVYNPDRILWDESLRTISVRAAPEAMKEIEETIRRFDVSTSSQNLEFAIYLLTASPEPGRGSAMPEALDPVIKQMSTAFAFKSYKLADTLLLRTRDGEGAEASSVSTTPGIDGQSIFYQCRIGSARVVPGEKDRSIRINGLRVGMKVPYLSKGGTQKEYQYADIGVNTDIDVRDGQRAVVGKATMQGNEAMIVVLVPKILP